ncbi:hypothetical protein B0H13DRAFT_1867051 [Mycena leptocephala]|nr:hypothetical protein B0H13DRAFT_1867051 [Mycena leptocephala]
MTPLETTPTPSTPTPSPLMAMCHVGLTLSLPATVSAPRHDNCCAVPQPPRAAAPALPMGSGARPQDRLYHRRRQWHPSVNNRAPSHAHRGYWQTILRPNRIPALYGRAGFRHPHRHLPRVPPLVRFAGPFQGLTILPNDPERAYNILFNAIMANPDITRFVHDCAPTFMTANEVLTVFDKSISVTSIQLTLPAASSSAPVMSPAATRSAAGSACTDHPTNLCPLKDVPGYLSITPESLSWTRVATHSTLPAKIPKPKESLMARGRGRIAMIARGVITAAVTTEMISHA